MTTKADKIRAALAGNASLTRAEIEAAIGEKLDSAPSIYVKGLKGQVIDGERRYSLTPKKVKGFRAEARERKAGKSRIAKIADKVAARPKVDSLALQNLLAAGKNLRVVIRDVVEDMDGCEQLLSALQLHENAEQLVGALQA
jgi:hypothetical protein